MATSRTETPTGSTRTAPAALWGVYGVVAVVSSVLVLRRPEWERLSDLHIYYGAIRHLHTGGALYEFVAENGGPFTYPPFAALVLSPIGLLPEGALQLGWLVLTCAAVAAIGIAAGRALAPDRQRRPLVVAATAVALLLSAPAQSNLRFGQVSVFVVLLALVDGMRLTPARYRGVLVGIAAAIKLTPLLFVLYFLLARRFRDAGRALAAFLLCGLVGAAVLPAESVIFWTGTFLNTNRVGNLASLGNQSLHGMLLRIGVDGATFPLLWLSLVLVIGGIALLRARRLEFAGQPAHAAVLVGCATVAVSPVSWTHHQIWPVLAAMLLIGAYGVARRVAGAVLLVVMVLSLGALLSAVSMTPGLQFLFENSRLLAVVTLCLVGFGGVAVAAVAAGRRTGTARGWLRVATAAVAGVAFFAVQPLPAGADPTFKAYAMSDVHNPRYFFVCRSAAGCAAFGAGAPVTFGVTAEKTKVRVNGVVDPAVVARLEYQSAPGGAARTIPLLEVYPGQRLFSFRSANLSHGRLTAYRADGTPVAVYTEELTAG
ncbi:glycosyltransferase 87 family protein [Micromonospora sp. WMMD1102]|uniref:glycosyltransferase 87 family protein n=1 Tax=Micromonospora sp. WMMD1102 TaxID=3016105 RepID=UPI0024154E30|nr:glycosyltransferase 87 family protein [Micromonospora sp. WMMD1102]MDG4786191.1 glycosyltransferase 87 family protein [Micromonospora sp. WMMD1102]